MAITEKQIIDSLIAFYEREGVDLSLLFRDTTFTSLPLDKKVSIIKDYAGRIKNGVSRESRPIENTLMKVEMGGKALFGAASGAAASMAAIKAIEAGLGGPLAKSMQGKSIIGTVMIASALMGASAGALGGYMSTRPAVLARKALYKQLDRTEKDPSTENAISVLSVNNEATLQNINPSTMILGSLSKTIPDILMNRIGPLGENFYKDIHRDRFPDLYKPKQDNQ